LEVAKVIIISIGDEILIGQIANTNATWMAEILNSNGFNTVEIRSIADDENAILNTLKSVRQLADLVLVTGGLGPTKDDKTKQIICDFFDSQIIINDAVLAHVKSFFAIRNKELTELNYKQAEVPDNCEVVHNAMGTAPGMYFVKENIHFVFMPGVPFEMENIMKTWVIPEMCKRLFTKNIIQKTILTHGLGESFLADKISKWENSLPTHIKLAYLPTPGKVRLRLRGIGDNRGELQMEIEKKIQELQIIIPNLIYGFDDDLMEEIIGNLLRKNKLTLSTAESCTGGFIAHKITEIAGSSDYFKGSVVAYSNEIKEKVLGISAKNLLTYGAVSEQVIIQMAEGVRKLFDTDYAIATSGIAGPSGGTTEKSVGTVWIALSSSSKTIAKKFNFGNHRIRNINLSFLSAINMLRMELLNSD